MKAIFFVQELSDPERIPAGSTRSVTPEEAEWLRSSAPEGAMLDISLNPVADAFAWLRGEGAREVPYSSAVLMPCPWCMEHNPKTGAFRVARELTHCKGCNDSRTIVVAGLWDGSIHAAIKMIEGKRDAANQAAAAEDAEHGRADPVSAPDR